MKVIRLRKKKSEERGYWEKKNIERKDAEKNYETINDDVHIRIQEHCKVKEKKTEERRYRKICETMKVDTYEKNHNKKNINIALLEKLK